MIALPILGALVVLFILLEAFFSGSEIAFISANRPRLFRRTKDKQPAALLAKALLSQPERLFSTTVIGTNLAMNFATTLVTGYVVLTYGFEKEFLVAIFLTPIILIFGEFVPKMFARSHADELVLKVAAPIRYASLALWPLTKGFSIYAQVLKRVLGESPEKGFFLSREEIKGALPASRGTDVTPGERLLIERILESGKTTAKEILRPLIEVVGIEEEQTIEDAVRLIGECGHSRLPVYRERVDKIVGVIHAFGLIHSPDLKQPIKTLMRPAFFVPESKPLDELLLDLKTRPMAIAVNEYGGAEGVITMEDVMEEIVGEIEDEYDEPPRLYRRIGENSYIVNARMEVDDLREVLKIPIPKDDDYQTLAGFLLKRMQKIPKKWDSTIIDNVEYVVQSATDRAIEEVYIIVHEKPATDSGKPDAGSQATNQN